MAGVAPSRQLTIRSGILDPCEMPCLNGNLMSGVEHYSELRGVHGENVFGGFGPDERFQAGVVLQQVVVDRSFQFVDAGVAPPTEVSVRDLGEGAFHQVHPRGIGRRRSRLVARQEPGEKTKAICISLVD